MALDQRVSGQSLISLDEDGLPREVYALLAQANLLRMRGCWEEAVQNCMEALRLAPESHSAQSLLGDIYENQGRYDDAIQWYRMALDIHAESPADQLKLNRLLRLQESGTSRPIDASLQTAAQESKGSGSHPPAGHRLAMNPEMTLRYASLGAALFVLLVVVFAYLAVHRHAALATLGLASDQEVETKMIVVPPAVAGTDPTMTAGSAEHDAPEQGLLNSLSASRDLNAQGIRVYNVATDPRTEGIAVTFGLAPSAGGNLSREMVLRSALLTAQVAANTPGGPAATVYTIRCLEIPSETNATNNMALVFVGDIQRSSIAAAAADSSGLSAVQLQTSFTNPWWSSQISG